ncbi:MAG: EF-hand domain-containing protein [Deltaproteobacteria bacterium]|nr:EF-hand domain-containing protein [Deltaproteobacteria bacterium]
MKGYRVWCTIMVLLIGISFFLTFNIAFAQQGKGPSDEMIRGAFQQVVAGADKNGDGKISMEECMSISKDKQKIEKDCKYWDANGDGIITEDEYVKQVRKIMQ